MNARIRRLLMAVGLSAGLSAHASDTVLLPLINQGCSFAGHFAQQRFLSGIDAALESTGHFFFHCERGVIWSTESPISEALVLLKDGAGYVVKDDATQQLTSRQNKFLGDLLNSLMAGDQAELNRRFAIQALADSNIFRLTPKQRSLKRGISHIDLTIDAQQAMVNLAIVDRNQQQTSIVSQRDTQFDSEVSIMDSCASVSSLQATVCALLVD